MSLPHCTECWGTIQPDDDRKNTRHGIAHDDRSLCTLLLADTDPPRPRQRRLRSSPSSQGDRILTISTMQPRNSSSLGGDRGDKTLDLVRWTPEQRAEYERRAALRIADQQREDAILETLQMLGLAPYESGHPPRAKEPKTPIKHGTRGGHTNRGCGKSGSPPCPASPTCKEADNAFWRNRRRKIRTTNVIDLCTYEGAA